MPQYRYDPCAPEAINGDRTGIEAFALATGTQLRVERFKHDLKVSLIADEHERASEVISLTRTDAPGNPPPAARLPPKA